MPAMMNETITPGPASGTAWASTKKMPVPIVAPTPNMVSWKVPKLRLRFPDAPDATGAPLTGRRRSISSRRLIDVVGNYEPASHSASANRRTAQSISCAVITNGGANRRAAP
ncbi:Uncharacterised protein [Mycobacterium tuberculosis]|uniref:Uncharacterized protein n=1 Tax=Mycobacterium tuberculosis TaxID=1773 RepID=A0A655A980_MYCTX|nr:Uncharacterised protein [Mycobacterium tuberculosis]CKQ26232.1 Uncharacterised protein [Mycobacterium tuberculosis]CKR38434.1 Uncharacterised protein [Mycobacterium tuberculosis]CKS60864.1 Uncharacterised protein [Mycobacterium tuberculosis]CKS75313.1 Uncharacterised protein [Mycobacterium tuberculosis]